MAKVESISYAMAGREGNPLRILVGGIVWPPETFIERLIKGMVEAGAEITVACDQKPTAAWLPHPRMKWLYAPLWRGSSRAAYLARTIRMIPRAMMKGAGDIRKFRDHISRDQRRLARFYRWHQLLPFAGVRTDVIYFPWNSAAISYLPLFDLGYPVILSCRGAQVNIAPLDPGRSSMKKDLLSTFQKAAAVHCVSKAIMNEAQKYGLQVEKSTVIHPAVDPQFFHPAEPSTTELPGRAFHVTTIGSLIWRKGYEYALQAIRELKDKGINIRFNILGDGPERQRVLYTVNDLELNDVVELHGRNSPEDVRRVLQRSDAFLLTSLSEGISNAVLEAMACGVPVVTTDCGGMREAVTDGVEGFVVPTRDTAAIVRALAHLWEHQEVRLRMGLAGRQRIERSFSLSHQVEDFIAVCRSLTAPALQV